VMATIENIDGKAQLEIKILEHGEVRRGSITEARAFLDRLAVDHPNMIGTVSHVR
jgi:hypothetical protein